MVSRHHSNNNKQVAAKISLSDNNNNKQKDCSFSSLTAPELDRKILLATEGFLLQTNFVN